MPRLRVVETYRQRRELRPVLGRRRVTLLSQAGHLGLELAETVRAARNQRGVGLVLEGHLPRRRLPLVTLTAEGLARVRKLALCGVELLGERLREGDLGA